MITSHVRMTVTKWLSLSIANKYCTASNSNLPRLTLFTKSGECSLCEDIKEALEPYLHAFEYKEVDISLKENEFWKLRYRYEIPVIHIDGKFLLKHRFDEQVIKAKLSELHPIK